MGSSPVKQNHASDQMSAWGRAKYGNIPAKIKDLQATLEILKNKVPSKDCIQKIRIVENSLDDLLKQEEVW